MPYSTIKPLLASALWLHPTEYKVNTNHDDYDNVDNDKTSARTAVIPIGTTRGGTLRTASSDDLVPATSEIAGVTL